MGLKSRNSGGGGRETPSLRLARQPSETLCNRRKQRTEGRGKDRGGWEAGRAKLVMPSVGTGPGKEEKTLEVTYNTRQEERYRTQALRKANYPSWVGSMP